MTKKQLKTQTEKKRFKFKPVISHGIFECSYKDYRVRIDTNGPTLGWIIIKGKVPIASATSNKKPPENIHKLSDEYIASMIKQMVVKSATETHYYTEQLKQMVCASNVLTKGL